MTENASEATIVVKNTISKARLILVCTDICRARGLWLIPLTPPLMGTGYSKLYGLPHMARKDYKCLGAIVMTYLKQLHTTKQRSEEHTSELQSRPHLVCRLLLEKKKNT